MTLATTEFLRGFFLHVLPNGIRAHPSLWLPRQSPSCFPLGSIPTSAVEQLLHASRSCTLQSFGGGFFCLALPTLRRDHDRGSEIHGCGIINMLLLRFFITPLSLSTRGCAQARGRRPVSASSPLPRQQLSACALTHLTRHSHHPDGIPTRPRRSPQAAFRSRLPFKSHSATASAANASGFLLVSLSKTPRIEIPLRPLQSAPRRFRSRLRLGSYHARRLESKCQRGYFWKRSLGFQHTGRVASSCPCTTGRPPKWAARSRLTVLPKKCMCTSGS